MLFRIVVDEDVVPGVPPFQSYHHFGSEILIDGLRDTGCIIINPSYVEKKFIQKTKSSVKGHLPGSYMNGLANIKAMTELSGSNDDFQSNSSYFAIIDNSTTIRSEEKNNHTIKPTQKSFRNHGISRQESHLIMTNVSIIVDFSANKEHIEGVILDEGDDDDEEEEEEELLQTNEYYG